MGGSMFRIAGILLFPLLLAAQSGSPQTNQNPARRDLRLELPDGPAPALAGTPRGYALVVGVSKYQKLDPAANLGFAESDAEAMYRVLISQEGGAFPAENVHLLKGSQATLSNIRREVEMWLPSVAQPPDRVIVYFAGHGLVKS